MRTFSIESTFCGRPKVSGDVTSGPFLKGIRPYIVAKLEQASSNNLQENPTKIVTAVEANNAERFA